MSILSEEWRDIPGFEGRYQVSNLGRVRAIWQRTASKRGRLLKSSPRGPARRRYLSVSLQDGRHRRSRFVHVLVMRAFVGPPPPKHEIDHVDNDPLNPRLSNLEYVTRAEQLRRAYRRDGRRGSNRGGELAPVATFTWEQVREIRRRLKEKEISGRALARELGVAQKTISDIFTGRNWKDACVSPQ